MDAKLLLLKSITLLYRESQLKESSENSSELVKTVLETIQVPETNVGLNTDRDVIRNLKETCLEMSLNSYEHDYDLVSLLQTLRMNCGYDERLYDNIESSLKQDIKDSQIKRNVVGLRISINNYFKSKQIENILTKASSDFKHHRDKVGDVNTFIGNVIGQLETLQISTTSKDPAVITDMCLSDTEATSAVFKSVKNMHKKEGLLVTGWQALNKMCQGGFRRGEFIVTPGLQHKYKTGLSLSIFQQIPIYNTPVLLNPNRRPLLLRISFEDDLRNNLQFIYIKLRYEETGDVIDIEKLNISEEEMTKYVQTRLGINGFEIMMLRVDPSQWTYKNICNKIIELEAEGYEIIFCMLDYIGKLPTTGCTAGPTGADRKDMFRRLRNFFSAKGITLYSPHQISTEAKMLIRQGIPEDQFVKEIDGRGYYMDCRSLDTEIDIEIYQHIFKHQGVWYLSLQRGKHRIPTIVPEEYKYFLLPFPKHGMPIPDDVGKDCISMNKLPRPGSQQNDTLFNF